MLPPSTLVQFSRNLQAALTPYAVGHPFSTSISSLVRKDGSVLTASEIQQAFALPTEPTAMSIVTGYPTGVRFYTGAAAKNRFGSGGGWQIFGEANANLAEGSTVTIDSALAVSANESHNPLGKSEPLGSNLTFPDRAIWFQHKIKKAVAYGHRVLVRFATEIPDLDFLSAWPLTIDGFKATFRRAISPKLAAYIPSSMDIHLEPDTLDTVIGPSGHVIKLPDTQCIFTSLSDGFLALAPRVWEEPRNLFFYEFDGRLRWRVNVNPTRQKARFTGSFVTDDGRLFGTLDWHVGDIFEIDRASGAIIGHEKDPIRCQW